MFKLKKFSSFGLCAILVFSVFPGCDEHLYPEPTESYSAVGGFEITRVGDEDPGPYSIGDAEGDAEWGFWYPYSITQDSQGNLLVTNIRGGYIERFIPNLDGSAIWDAYWIWPRGRKDFTYQLFIDMLPGSSPGGETAFVSESQSEIGDLGFELGRKVYKLSLPEPTHDEPGDNRPRYAEITSFDFLIGYEITSQPGPVAYYPEDRIVFTDVQLGELFHYEGQTLTARGGSYGDQEGRFYRPMGICVTPDEQVVVTDTYNSRLQLFTIEATPEDPKDTDYDPVYPYIFRFQRIIGEFGFNNGQLSSPLGVAADSEGNIYVCDTRNSRIQKFDDEGGLLAVIYGEGYWRLRSPLDLVVTDEGDIWVIDAFVWYEPWEDEYLPEDQARIILFRRD